MYMAQALYIHDNNWAGQKERWFPCQADVGNKCAFSHCKGAAAAFNLQWMP